MREIRFRAWDKKSRIMSVEVTLFHGLKDWEKDRVEIMQYTGLKDKNGKEIYEGDIIIGQSPQDICVDEKMVVSWNHKFASFCIDKEGWMFSHYFGEAIEPENIEVIGNIYENQELINNQKEK